MDADFLIVHGADIGPPEWRLAAQYVGPHELDKGGKCSSPLKRESKTGLLGR
jgi:hypothetical protein